MKTSYDDEKNTKTSYDVIASIWVSAVNIKNFVIIVVKYCFIECIPSKFQEINTMFKAQFWSKVVLPKLESEFSTILTHL